MVYSLFRAPISPPRRVSSAPAESTARRRERPQSLITTPTTTRTEERRPRPQSLIMTSLRSGTSEAAPSSGGGRTRPGKSVFLCAKWSGEFSCISYVMRSAGYAILGVVYMISYHYVIMIYSIPYSCLALIHASFHTAIEYNSHFRCWCNNICMIVCNFLWCDPSFFLHSFYLAVFL